MKRALFALVRLVALENMGDILRHVPHTFIHPWTAGGAQQAAERVTVEGAPGSRGCSTGMGGQYSPLPRPQAPGMSFVASVSQHGPIQGIIDKGSLPSSFPHH